jgi:hypothetical protein
MAAPASHNARPGATAPAGGEAQLIGGRYRLVTPIGRGAMGVVWSAGDELFDREVAVKEVRLPPSLSETERDNGYQRTLREVTRRAGSVTRAWPRFTTSSQNVGPVDCHGTPPGPFS